MHSNCCIGTSGVGRISFSNDKFAGLTNYRGALEGPDNFLIALQ